MGVFQGQSAVRLPTPLRRAVSVAALLFGAFDSLGVGLLAIERLARAIVNRVENIGDTVTVHVAHDVQNPRNHTRVKVLFNLNFALYLARFACAILLATPKRCIPLNPRASMRFVFWFSEISSSMKKYRPIMNA